LILVLSIVFGLFSSLFSEVKRGGDILIQVDVCRFKAKEGWTFLETYFAFPRNQLSHEQVGDNYEANFEIRINIVSNDSLVTSRAWQLVDRVTSLEDIKSGQQIFDLYSVFIREGHYTLKALVRDQKGGKSGWYEQDFDVIQFPENHLAISDIQFGYNITPDQNKGKFIKNGYRILPNPSRVFGKRTPLLYYYSEIYNLSPLGPGIDSTYLVKTIFKNARGEVVKELPAKKRIRGGSSLVEIGQLYVGSLTPGIYQLEIQVIDNAKADTAIQRKNFLLYGEQKLATKSKERKDEKRLSEFSGMSEKELDELFNQMRYITTSAENKIYKKLKLDGKRQFMSDFWKKRDPDKSTEVNEFMLEYFQRVAVANARFSIGNKQGWKTDQGRVYLLYGEPDEIDRYPSSLGERPYEIWYYNKIEGGIEFVFVDLTGFGEMQLVHSTSRNEIQDYDWRARWLVK